MPDVTVREYADVIGITVERLQEQLMEAGLSERSADDQLSDAEKAELLGFLRRKRGMDDDSEPRKITLKRKTVSELKVPVGSQGRGKSRSKTVSVEFRKRRTYAKRSSLEEEAAQKAAEEKALQDQKAAEEARKQAEEEAAREKAQAEAEAAEALVRAEQEAAREKELESAREAQEAAVQQAKEQKNEEVIVATPEFVAQQEEKEKAAGKGAEKKSSRYHRKELHVATDKSGRRKKKQRSRPVVNKPTQHGFEKPTAPVVREVEIPESISVAETRPAYVC